MFWNWNWNVHLNFVAPVPARFGLFFPPWPPVHSLHPTCAQVSRKWLQRGTDNGPKQGEFKNRRETHIERCTHEAGNFPEIDSKVWWSSVTSMVKRGKNSIYRLIRWYRSDIFVEQSAYVKEIRHDLQLLGSLHQPPGESNTHRHQEQTNDEFGRKSVPSLSGRFDCGTLTLFTGPTQAPPLPVMAPPRCRWISGTFQTGKNKIGLDLILSSARFYTLSWW